MLSRTQTHTNVMLQKTPSHIQIHTGRNKPQERNRVTKSIWGLETIFILVHFSVLIEIEGMYSRVGLRLESEVQSLLCKIGLIACDILSRIESRL